MSVAARINSAHVRIEMIPVGRSEIPGPELFWMREWDRWFELCFQVALIRRNDRVILVNTGPAEDLAPMNAQWASFLGERATMRRQPGEFIVDALRARGVMVEDVTDIVLTPLQLYTVSNVPRFPNATVHVAKRGWIHFHTTHDHPHDDRDSSLPPEVLSYLVGEAWSRVCLLEDEDEIMEGVRTWWAGAHHRASLVVEVDTARGVVALSDAYFYLENVEKRHPIGITENMYEALACYDRVARSSQLVLPLYDPKNLKRFPGGLVSDGM
jgi:hypothetical protein